MTANDYRRMDFTPHSMVRDVDGKVWELISYPFTYTNTFGEESPEVFINIREFNEPTTMVSHLITNLTLICCVCQRNIDHLNCTLISGHCDNCLADEAAENNNSYHSNEF